MSQSLKQGQHRAPCGAGLPLMASSHSYGPTLLNGVWSVLRPPSTIGSPAYFRVMHAGILSRHPRPQNPVTHTPSKVPPLFQVLITKGWKGPERAGDVQSCAAARSRWLHCRACQPGRNSGWRLEAVDENYVAKPGAAASNLAHAAPRYTRSNFWRNASLLLHRSGVTKRRTVSRSPFAIQI